MPHVVLVNWIFSLVKQFEAVYDKRSSCEIQINGSEQEKAFRASTQERCSSTKYRKDQKYDDKICLLRKPFENQSLNLWHLKVNAVISGSENCFKAGGEFRNPLSHCDACSKLF